MDDISALIRATLFVRDLDRSTAFYRALGLTETYYAATLAPGSGTAPILGFTIEGDVRIRILKRPGPNYGMIGLFEMDRGFGAEDLAMPSGPARYGEVALIFYVRSMTQAMATVRAHGATWTPEPVIFSQPHTAQPEVCIRDPDGVLVNLVEKDPAMQELTGPPGQA